MQSEVGGGGELSISIINALNNIICFSAAAEEEEREGGGGAFECA